MEIGAISSVGMSVPLNPSVTDNNVPDRQIVGAVQELNQSALMGDGRELTYRRDPKSGQFVIQILKVDTGDVVDQIPPEVLLQLQQDFKEELQGKGTPA